jgi:autotransporter-associated beta strand protein
MKHLTLVAAALALLTSSALAASSTWTGSIAAIPYWVTTGNWSPNVVPNTTTAAFFQNDNGATVFSIDLGAGPDSALGIVFNAGAGSSGYILRASVTPSSSLNVAPMGIVNNDTHVQTFSYPVTMIASNGSGGVGASQTWTANNGNLLFSGTYGAFGTANTINNNGGALTLTGGGNITIGNATGRGDIVGTGSLVKNGSGTLFLGGTNANTFSGGLTLNSGTLVAGKVGALGNGVITLAGGTLQGNYLNLSAPGALKLTGNSIIDFAGPGPFTLPNPSTISFGDSHGQTWAAGQTLTVADWVQGDALRFGTGNTGLTAGQLGQIVFAGFPDSYAAIDANGFVTPVPEPSTVALSLLGGFSLAIGLIIRRRKE